MPCKNCKHPAIFHDYDPDYRKRYLYRIPAVYIGEVCYEQKEVCNCKEFVK